MSEVNFFVPSTSFGGSTPRLPAPLTDLGEPGTGWLPGVVDNGIELRWFLEIFEPLLLALHVAGYAAPEISIVSVDGTRYEGGLTFDTETSRVDLLTDRADAEAVIFEPPSGLLAHFRLAPIVTLSDQQLPVLRAIELPLDGLSGTGLIVRADALSGDARSRFRTPVIGLVESVLDELDHAEGLLDIYDWSVWSGRSEINEAAAAMLGIAVGFHPDVSLTGWADLVQDLGALDEAAPSGPYSMLLLRDRLASTPGMPGDADWWLSRLRTGLTAIGLPGDDCSTTSFTGALLEFHSRGVIDLVGSVPDAVAPSDDQVAEVLARPTPLDADDIDLLGNYLAAGQGELLGEVSARLVVEYTESELPAVRGAILDSLIAACRSADAVPIVDEASPQPGSFEDHLSNLASIVGFEVWTARDPVRIGEFLRDLWARWSTWLTDAQSAEKFHYGAAILFVECADFDLQLTAVETLVAYYTAHVVGPSQGAWRFPDLAPDGYVGPIGWSEGALTAMLRTLSNVPYDDEFGERILAARYTIESLVGDGLFEILGIDENTIASRFVEVVQAAAAQPGASAALVDYGHLTEAIAARHDTLDPAAADRLAGRLRMPIVLHAIEGLLAADNGLAEQLTQFKLDALDDVTAPLVDADAAELQRAWFTSDATLAFFALLTDNERAIFEADELGALAYAEPSVASECVQAAIGQAVVSASGAFVEGVPDDEAASAVSELLQVVGVDDVTETDVAKIVGFLKSGVTRVEGALPSVFEEAYSSELAMLKNLDENQLLDRSFGDVVADLDAWKQRANLNMALGSRSLAAVAAIISARQLASGQYTGTADIISKAGSVASGIGATVEIGIALTEVIVDNTIARPALANTLDDVLALAGMVGKLVGAVTVALGFVAVATALETGDPFAFSVAIINLSFTIAPYLISSTAVLAGIPVVNIIAVAALGFGLAVFAYDLWTRGPAYEATLRRYEALWDDLVELESPIAATVTEFVGDEVLLHRTITQHDDLVVISVDEDTAEAGEFGAWQASRTRLRYYGADGPISATLRSELPGRITGHDLASGLILPLDRAVMTIEPLCEHAIRLAGPVTVTAWEVALGELVDAGQTIVSVQFENAAPEGIPTPYRGRVQSIAQVAQPDANVGHLDPNEVLARIQLDEYDVIVEGDSP